MVGVDGCFGTCLVAVEDVGDGTAGAGEFLEGEEVFFGDCGSACGVGVGVAVVGHCDDVELSFGDVAGVGGSGGLVSCGDVGVIEGFFFVEDRGGSAVDVFPFFGGVKCSSGEGDGGTLHVGKGEN